MINGVLTQFVIENAAYFGLEVKEDDIVRLFPSMNEPGEFDVRVGSNKAKNLLVVCPVGKCIGKVDPKAQEVVDMDEDELLSSPF